MRRSIAANGKVSATGTSQIGRASTAAAANGDVVSVVYLQVGGGSGGGSGPAGPKGMNWRGPYSSVTNYVVDDGVSSGGSSYIAIQPSVNQPVTNALYWQLFASKGDPGTPGTPGNPGSIGPAGLIWRNAYNSGTAYVVNDAVAYQGSSYRNIARRRASSQPTLRTGK